MASLPPQQSARRRSSPRESSSEAPRALPRSNSGALSTTSEDSQTVLLSSHATGDLASLSQSQDKAPQNTSPQQAEADEPRRCWICMNDETEDTPETSEWRNPCKCALVAHESCLLDWIADMESPTSRRRTGSSGKIECPQCKSEIVLARPRSYVIDAVRAVERLGGVLMLPGACFVGVYTLYQGCLMHGVSTVYAIFGLEDGNRILAPLYPPLGTRNTNSVFLATLKEIPRNLRLDIGLALIPVTLVASRTTFADSILPILPMLFFATSPQADEILNIGHWPPSAALSIAMLPYLRAAYNAYYDKVWGPKEREWLKSIQPRAGAGQDGANGGGQDDDPDRQIMLDEGDGVVELNIDLNIIEEWEEHQDAADNDQQQQQEQQAPQQDEGVQQVLEPDRGPAPPLHQPPLDVAPAEAAPDNPPAAPPVPREERREGGIILSTTRIADTVLGALIFPSVAAAVGELLRVSLPLSWTKAKIPSRPTGMLQTRWGRSLVGGCLFVVVKDAVMLYVRWKMAQNHRKRRVLDYDKNKGRMVRPGES